MNVWEHPLYSGSVENEDRDQKFVEENQTDSLLKLPQQAHSTRDDGEAENDLWSALGDFTYRNHVVHRDELYMLKEESFPFPLKYMDVTRTTHASLDVLLEKNMMISGTWMEKGNFQMHGQVSQYSFLEWKATWRSYMVWRGACEETHNLSFTECTGSYVETCLMRRKRHRWAIEKPKFDNANQFWCIFIIEADDQESQHTMRNARRKLETPMTAAMLVEKNKDDNTFRNPGYATTER